MTLAVSSSLLQQQQQLLLKRREKKLKCRTGWGVQQLLQLSLCVVVDVLSSSSSSHVCLLSLQRYVDRKSCRCRVCCRQSFVSVWALPQRRHALRRKWERSLLSFFNESVCNEYWLPDCHSSRERRRNTVVLLTALLAAAAAAPRFAACLVAAEIFFSVNWRALSHEVPCAPDSSSASLCLYGPRDCQPWSDCYVAQQRRRWRRFREQQFARRR